MSAFDIVFDAATSTVEPSAAAPRRRKGAAIEQAESINVSPPLSTPQNPPARAARAKANSMTEPGFVSPSLSTPPAKSGRRKKAISQPEPGSFAPSSAIPFDGHQSFETHSWHAVDSDHSGHPSPENHYGCAGVIAEIQALWKMRQRWHRAEKALVLQSKAICRAFLDGDKDAANKAYEAATKGQAPSEDIAFALVPFLSAIERFKDERRAIEKRLKKSARGLPAYDWALATPGFGEASFAAIVGEAGDVGSYKSVSALWKRMGLAVFDGERQRKKANADEAALHGYSPARRSVMWNVGGGLIGGMGHGPRPRLGEDVSSRDDLSDYQKLFIERCRYLAAREPEKYARKPVEKTDKKTGEVAEFESYSAHCSAAAKRYVEKRFLRKLYAAWRKETLGVVEDPDEIALPLAAE